MCLSFLLFLYFKQLISHTLHFDCCQDQSEANSQTETSKVSLGDNESKEDMEVEVHKVNKDKTSVDDSDLAESGKKDPFVRRQELLIKSGLAEVGFPSNNLIVLPCFTSVLH